MLYSFLCAISAHRIPANAFLDAKGLPVKGEVKLFYKELNSAQAIMLSGIPMDSKGGQLESAAMFEIRATQNDKPVFPNPNATIEILFPTTPIGTGFSFYNYDEEKGEWNDQGVEPLVDPPLSPNTIWNSMNSFVLNRGREIPRPIGLSLDAFAKKDRRFRGKERGLQIRLHADKRSKSWMGLSFEDLRKLNNLNWVYVGDQSRSNLKKIKNRISKIRSCNNTMFSNALGTVNKERVLTDCWLTPDYENDHFLMHLATLSDTLHLPVVPFTFAGDYQEQKQLAKLFLKYESRFADRQKDWQKKLRQFYEAAEKDVAEGEADLIKSLTADFKSDDGLKKPRQVQVVTFGICNIDKVIPMMSEEILVQCTDASGTKLKIKSITICNERVRTVMDFPGAIIQVPSFKQNSMLVKFEDGRVASIKPKEFKRGINLRKNTANYSVSPFIEKSLEDVYKDFMASN